MSITANDGENNSNSKIYVDGVQRQTEPMLEDGAYFTFHAEGRDSYFKMPLQQQIMKLLLR